MYIKCIFCQYLQHTQFTFNNKLYQMHSPIGARRVKTDLLTSEKNFLHTSPTRPCSSLNPKVQSSKSPSSIRSQLPARATRLLQRRLQNSSNTPSHTGSDSPRSVDSNSRRTTPLYKPPSNTQLKDSNDDLLQLDKSFRNTILQDVVNFKTQLVRLRRILQEDEEKLMRTDTLNPFENNGPFFNSCIIDQNTDVSDSNKQTTVPAHIICDQQNVILEDQRQELADLRRQVVYLQSQMDDKDRTIRIQQNMITKLEAEIDKTPEMSAALTMTTTSSSLIETNSAATQTDRLRPLSIGQEGLASRSKSQVRKPSSKLSNNNNSGNNIKPFKSSLPKKTPLSPTSSTSSTTSSMSSSSASASSSSVPSTTQITSVYTKLSSVKPTNGGVLSYSQQSNYIKPVRTTFIGQTNGHHPHATAAATKKASTIPTPLVRTVKH